MWLNFRVYFLFLSAGHRVLCGLRQVFLLGKQSSQRDESKKLRLPTLDQLNAVWNGVLKDPTARRALDQLEQDGFKTGDLRPRDPTFHNPSWIDYIAAIPLVENRPSRSHFYWGTSFRKHLPLVRVLRNFARQFDDEFCEKVISTRNAKVPRHEELPDLANQAASFIEKFLSWDSYVRERNPRNALIAELRWTIRARTGKPHDRELSTLIDAACRAADHKELCLDNTTLDRMEKREKESRVKSARRLNFRTRLSRTRKSNSTQNPKKRS